MGWVASYSKHSSSQSRFRGDFTSLIVPPELGLGNDEGGILNAELAPHLTLNPSPLPLGAERENYFWDVDPG
jgi:hypothetical protein